MPTPEPTSETPVVADAESLVEGLKAQLAEVTRERDLLRASHERLRLELELIKRRLFVAKAERVDTSQLELEFAQKLAELNHLAGLPVPGASSEDQAPPPRRKPTGRRDLKALPLEEERIELTDPVCESLVAQGRAQRMGFEESAKIAYRRGGLRQLVIARVKYRVTGSDGEGEGEVETTPMPEEAFPRSLAAPSLLARIATEKHCDGLPLFRIEDRSARDGVRLERGTMSRWLEDLGATLGATVIEAARKHALANAFCIATDATGVLVQPEPRSDNKRQPCRRGHFFVLIADRDHIFFEYTPKETSKVVSQMFAGYSGFIQADAKSVYDALFRPPEDGPPDGERQEVGCWSHCRTHFWEATWAHSAVAREAIVRIGRIFDVDATFRGKAPAQIKQLRDRRLRPHMEAFFAWAEQQYELVKDQRGPVRSALGYAVRQKGALMCVLQDGRLVLENNRSERELRRVAVGRKAWLFTGSDDHAQSAGHLFSMIASARLHGLDPETYLRDIIRVLAHWPKDRYLELAPKFWAATRATLDEHELAMEVGPLTVPTSPSPSA